MTTLSYNNNMKKTVAFICVHNSCRSQMAEGYARTIGSKYFDAYSAGTEEYPQVKPKAVQVMEEDNIDMSSHKPKLLKDIPEKLNIIITMGCNVNCPSLPCNYREDWGLDDPSGGPVEGFRETRDVIKSNILNLIKRVENGEFDK